MKISVITVCYQSESTIRNTIESVLSQTYSDIEYIVVDGSSEDRTASVVAEYADRIAKFVSEPDKGIYDAMNKGIRLATGDIIGILNSDDVFEDKTVLTHVARVFHKEPDADIVFGDIVISKRDDISKVMRYYRSGHFKSWKLRYGWMPPHPATFVKRSAYDKSGLYRLNYRIAADFEMFVRWLLIHRLRCFATPRVLVRMRMGGLGTRSVKSCILLNREIVRACRSNGVYTNLFLVLSKLPFKLIELFRRPAVTRLLDGEYDRSPPV